MADRFLDRDDPDLDHHWWISSVTYVAALSIWALVAGHWSSWQAARVEVEQRRQEDEREQHPLEEKVVQAIIANTDVATVDGY